MTVKSQTVDKTTKDKVKYGRMTKLEETKVRKLEEDQETKEILETGQKSKKKGEKAVKQLETIRFESQKRQDDEVLNKLSSRKKRFGSYKQELAKALVTYLTPLDWLPGWTADVVLTDGSAIKIKGRPFQTKEGILLVVCAPDGRVFHQGILVTKNPVMDYQAVLTLSIQTENQMDHERKSLLSSEPQRTNIPEKYQIKGVNGQSQGGQRPV